MIRLMTGDCREVLRGLEAESVDAVVTDPPYELGFMDRDWDRSGVAVGPETWAEVLRVVKPGGHMVAFGGTRTMHRIVCAIEDAGWEIRDVGAWCYWSGFPKSLDVSRSIDQIRDDRDDMLRLTAWIAGARDDAQLTNADIDAAFGFRGMAGHWTSQKSQPAVPTLDQWPLLLEVLDVSVGEVPDDIHRLAFELNGRKGEWGNPRPDREVTGYDDNSVLSKTNRPTSRGAPQTDGARRWSGWGTGLKPAYEPWVLARRPLDESSIARQVLATGTGAINIDACRFSVGDSMWPGPQDDDPLQWEHGRAMGYHGAEDLGPCAAGRDSRGRFPANLIHAPKASRAEREMGCEGLPTRTGAEAVDREEGSAGMDSPRAGGGRTAGNIRNWHPTVKPLRIMQWLVRLVTPPGGVVLDPFLGSGTTGMAAVGQGFDFLGIELDPDHMQIARARVEYAATGRDVECDQPDVREPPKQGGLF